MRVLIALAVASLVADACHADAMPVAIGLHTVSYHAGQAGENWNNRNPGLYARWDNGLTIGSYINSMDRRSTYLGYTVGGDGIFAVTLGVVSGYDRLSDDPRARVEWRCDGSWCRNVKVKDVILPMVVPSVRIPIYKRWSARVAAVVTPGSPPAAHLMVEYRR